MSPPAPRLFIAAWPPPAVVDRLRSLTNDERPDVRWIRSENWHVTLRFVGPAEPADVITRLDRTTLPSATAVLGPMVRRLGRNMVVVPVRGVDEVAAVVRAATADVGQPVDRRPFTGHITLGRHRPRTRSAAIDTELRPVSAEFRAEFRVDEVTLVKSTLGRGGAVYDVLARWPTNQADP